MKRRVVVTGVGCINPMGNDVETMWSGLKEGQSGVGQLTVFDAQQFPTRIAAEVKNWQITDTTIFPTSRDLLGGAHQANSSDYTRQVHASRTESPDGEYPVGTLIVKETFSWSGNDKQFAVSGGVLAMAKRGGGFNPAAGDWEWFELDSGTRQIIARGGSDMMGGMCNGCHASATGGTGADFVEVRVS